MSRMQANNPPWRKPAQAVVGTGAMEACPGRIINLPGFTAVADVSFLGTVRFIFS